MCSVCVGTVYRRFCVFSRCYRTLSRDWTKLLVLRAEAEWWWLESGCEPCRTERRWVCLCAAGRVWFMVGLWRRTARSISEHSELVSESLREPTPDTSQLPQLHFCLASSAPGPEHFARYRSISGPCGVIGLQTVWGFHTYTPIIPSHLFKQRALHRGYICRTVHIQTCAVTEPI